METVFSRFNCREANVKSGIILVLTSVEKSIFILVKMVEAPGYFEIQIAISRSRLMCNIL